MVDSVLVTQAALSLHLQLVLEETEMVLLPPFDEGEVDVKFSARVGDAPLWVMRWVRVTVLPGPVVVKVSVALRELVEVLGCTV